MSRKFAFLLAVAVLVATPSMLLAETSEEFAAANRFYEEKDYASAIRLYESVLAQGKESAAIYFNLGNAYFKNGDLGHAVLYYLKAKRLSPDDEDIRHNLEFARRFSSVQMEGVELNPIGTFFRSMVDRYRLSTVAWVSSMFFVLFVLILIVRFGIGINTTTIKALLTVGLILVLVFSGLTLFKYRIDYLDRMAVIVAEDSPVLTGPSEQSDLELMGAPGLVVEILGESDGYLNVLFENKRRGWIRKELVAEI